MDIPRNGVTTLFLTIFKVKVSQKILTKRCQHKLLFYFTLLPGTDFFAALIAVL